MTSKEMKFWRVVIEIRWSHKDSYYTDADVITTVAAFDEGHAIACATATLLAFGSPSEVFGAKATEMQDGGADE